MKKVDEINRKRSKLVDRLMPAGKYTESQRLELHWEIMDLYELYHQYTKEKELKK